jgi:arylsulfatase A-like enzyme/Tfp pilus assembly protein PilF
METIVRFLPANRWIAVALALAAGLNLGCDRAAEPELRVPDGTPIVLISVDTLRSDRLPIYGYGGVETPAIDALRRDGILFSRAYTHVPLTLPAHTSLLTGTLPQTHGVHDNLGYAVDAAATPLLQQALGSMGYATGAGVSAFVLRRETGIGAGFDFFDDDIELDTSRTSTGIQSVQRSGGATLDAVRPWLGEVAGGRFFLLLHLFEPHAPYEPPPEFAGRYDSPYDGEVAAADAVVGDLLDDLRSLGAYDRALVIFLSDHGEGLGDHGEGEHGVFLYRSTLQVPLIVKLPGSARAGDVVDDPVQLIDVFPTVLAALGRPLDARLRGTPLLARTRPHPDDRPIFAETFYPRLHFGWSDLGSAIVGRHHFIDAPQPEIYDLAEDPDELRNLVGANADLGHRLQTAFDEYQRVLATPAGADAETRRKLQALGYVGEAEITDANDLPDPKARIGVLAEIRSAHRLFAGGEFAAAAAAFERIVEAEPGIVDAWEYLALAQIGSGRTDEAAATYRRAIAAAPGSDRLAMKAATVFFRMGLLDEAAALATRGVTHDPAAAHGLLAQVALEEGNLDTAEDEARKSMVDTGSHQAAARRLLARVLVARGESALADQSWAEARNRFEDALDLDPNEAAAQLNLGLLNVAEGRTTEGRELLEAAVDELPASFRGWNALGMVYARQGDDEAAIAAWTRAHELRPAATEVLYNLGLAHAQAGRFSKAAVYLEDFAERAGPGPQRDQAMATARELRSRASRDR